jgi:sarcosine oxidase, subunit alpha
MSRQPRVMVAGAGPAGLAAATAAASAGASVTVIEERDRPGGQLCYRAQPVWSAPELEAERPAQLQDRLVEGALAAGAELKTGALVAGVFAGGELLLVDANGSTRLTPDALVVTTGSTDLPFPFSGSTFPGVFTARGVQILMNQHRVRPGRRFAIIGTGEQADELAVDIMLAGGEVVWSGIAPAPFLRADGATGVQRLTVGQDTFDVDVIAIAVGRQPDTALATMAGSPLAFAAELGGWVPLLDEQLRDRASGIFVAGDAAGVGSVNVSIAEGLLAGVAAAASLGLATVEDVEAARATGGDELAARIALRGSLAPAYVQPYQ